MSTWYMMQWTVLFFSSKGRNTIFKCDWISALFSSDLVSRLPASGTLSHSQPKERGRSSAAARSNRLFLRHLVDRVLDVRREIDRAGCPDADAGRNVGRQPAWRSRQPDRQIAGDFGDVSVLRIDFDNPFGADLGHDQFAVRRERDALRHLQVLGDPGFFAVGFNLRDLPGKGLRDIDIPLRTAD